MIELTAHLAETAPTLDDTFRRAVDLLADAPRYRPDGDYAILAATRARYGFAERPAPLLTPPDANAKLAKGVTPAYGLTLQHFRSVLPSADGFGKLSLNACPNAGHCVKVCVLDNGNGTYDSVQRARLWRTDLVARHPHSFARILAYELHRAVVKHGAIMFRPNVNSDVAWQTILPSLCDGYLPGITSYGYSKRPETLAGDGWLGSHYRVAYSWNERSVPADVHDFLARGGSVAVVTSRPKGSQPTRVFPFGNYRAVDADVTDEWLMGRAIVGDLSAKGKARALAGRSGFVVDASPVVLTVNGPRLRKSA
jgi:hypothetical protein